MALSRGNYRHGEARKGNYTPEYRIWCGMRARCMNPNVHIYSHYGGRGIKLCKRWTDAYINFLADMGRRPSDLHSIERINNDGNYEPSNCRWATDKEQARNTRTTFRVEFQGVVKPLLTWSEELGLSYVMLYKRIYERKWDVARAFTQPKRITA